MAIRTKLLAVALAFGLLATGLGGCGPSAQMQAVAKSPGTTPTVATPPKASLDDQITQLIKELGSDNFDEREKAEASLRQAGSRSKAALERAVSQTTDMEIKVRAARLLEDLQWTANHTLDLGGGIKMEFVLIPAGKFTMGSPAGEKGRDEGWPSEKQHEVSISQEFYMGKFAVTQEQYERVMGINRSRFKGAKKPVESVSWDDAQAFCNKLSATCRMIVRLPTEPEWEYACRAGSTTAYCFGDTENGLADYAWFRGNANDTTHPVGEKKPNAWGLYDMHGNVSEWCQDWCGDDATGGRVLRGGSWGTDPARCRSAFRTVNLSDFRNDVIGFRVVVNAPARAP